MGISATGLGSGLDTKSIVDQLVAAERQPQATRLAAQEARTTAQLTAVGRLKGALSTFQGALGGLTDLSKFQKRTATVSDTEYFSASTSESADPGSYQVEVLALAAAHRLQSAAFASAGTVIGEGQLDITVGTETMRIEITAASSTLGGIRDAINGATGNPGVRASIVTGASGAYLTLTATSTGTAHAITVDAVAGGSALEALEYGSGTTNSLTQQTAAANASIRIDGITVDSAGNSIGDAIEGVTIDLLKAQPGTLVSLDIAYDETAARDAVAKFVSAYNGLAGIIAELTSYDAKTGSAGTLLGDTATRTIKNALREALGMVAGDASAPFRTLAEIGVTTANNGYLALDPTKLAAAIDSDFDAVGSLLADEDHGIATRMKGIVDGFLASDGRISARESTLRTRLEDISGQRVNLDQRMESVRQRYQNQFTALDQLVSQLNQTSSFLSRQLAAL